MPPPTTLLTACPAASPLPLPPSAATAAPVRRAPRPRCRPTSPPCWAPSPCPRRARTTRRPRRRRTTTTAVRSRARSSRCARMRPSTPEQPPPLARAGQPHVNRHGTRAARPAMRPIWLTCLLSCAPHPPTPPLQRMRNASTNRHRMHAARCVNPRRLVLCAGSPEERRTQPCPPYRTVLCPARAPSEPRQRVPSDCVVDRGRHYCHSKQIKL